MRNMFESIEESHAGHGHDRRQDAVDNIGAAAFADIRHTFDGSHGGWL